jgi:hypothetical protein
MPAFCRSTVRFLISGLATCGAIAAGAADDPARAAPCAAAEHRAFDYLIGEWRIVETASGKHYAHNRVERILDGCGLRENLSMRRGVSGMSTSFYSPADRLWHMFFHDSLGFYAHLTGVGNAEGRQELTADVRFPAEPGRVRKARQLFHKDEAGRPRQIGYLLDEKTVTWQQMYDLTFCPAAQASEERKPPC